MKDLNTLLEEGGKWGADFGVHVNATESYPEAKAFSEQLVDKHQARLELAQPELLTSTSAATSTAATWPSASSSCA